MSVLHDDPVLVLFLVAGIGYLVGRIRVAGFGLGLSAVLFTGLAFSAWDSELRLPEFVTAFGLALFVYTTALASGPTFLHALRRRGLPANALVVSVLVLITLLAVVAHLVTGIGAAKTAGLFAGSLTNTPALAAVVEWMQLHGVEGEALSDPVVAYSVTYPIGVVGVLTAIFLLQRLWRIDYAQEARRGSPEEADIAMTAVRVGRQDLGPLGVVRREQGWSVSFGRYEHDGHQGAAAPDIRLVPGDVVTVVGSPSAVDEVVSFLGERATSGLVESRHDVDFRRMIVSDPHRAGRSVRELDLEGRFGAVVTRVRRGDVDLPAAPGTVLELGDRVRVVAPPARLGEISRWFGDSDRAVSEMDFASFSVGIALGLLLGKLAVPLPTGGTFRLSAAGGVLLVGLLLGALHRTGPIVWQPPHAVNLTLRQMGTVLFLAGVGTRSGPAFADTLGSAGVLPLVLAGAALTTTSAVLALVVGYRLLHVPMGTLLGVVAGLQTQPAVLAFACEQTRDETPNVGYSTVYPVALVLKIVLAQILVATLWS